MKKFNFLGLILSLGIFIAPAFLFGKPKINWVFDPDSDISGITRDSSERDLDKIFGSSNVKRYDVDIGEGRTAPGDIIYPGTENYMLITWYQKYSRPERIEIRGMKSMWRTREGLRVGMSIGELERMNRGKFSFSGFGGDNVGKLKSWEYGKMEQKYPKLEMEFAPMNQQGATIEEFLTVKGDKKVFSNNDVIRRMDVKVSCIRIIW